MDDQSSLVPGNDTGVSSDSSHHITMADAKTAEVFFEVVKQRLLDVNRWHDLSGKGTAVFQLTDEKGNHVDRAVKLGDHFRIDIPGPGSVSGKGYDWVQVEAIEHSHENDSEVLAIRVRPADNPLSSNDRVAHFFSEEASSTFSVTKTGKTITASVQGRNEKPNVQTGNVIDKVRNTMIAAGAMIGLNKPQWKSLVKGLLQENKTA